MEIKTYRAKTMQQALDLVRYDLGTEATVLHTREVNGGLVRRLVWGRHYEIAASRHTTSSQPACTRDRGATSPDALPTLNLQQQPFRQHGAHGSRSRQLPVGMTWPKKRGKISANCRFWLSNCRASPNVRRGRSGLSRSLHCLPT